MLRLVIAWLMLVAVWLTPAAAHSQTRELNVWAAASLKRILSRAGESYANKNGVRFVYNFAGSGDLARQIQQGGNADVFISASPKEIQQLLKDGALDAHSVRPISRNQLVVVIPADSKTVPKSLSDLSKVERLAVGNPFSVPAGMYAMSALTKAGVWKVLYDNHKLIFGSSVRHVLGYVDSGNVTAGLVYATDVAIAKHAKVAFSVPESMTGRVIYEAAVVKTTKHAADADSYLKWLVSPEVQTQFASAGYKKLSD